MCKLEKLSSIKDWGQTDHVTTPTRARLRCRWPRSHHAARLAALAHNTNDVTFNVNV